MNANRVVIDLSALGHNFRTLKQIAGPGTRMLSVVKADAYGHGLLPVATALERLGTDALGVFGLEEALELRGGGIRCPIVCLMGIFPEDAPEAVTHRVTCTVYHPDAARRLSEQALRSGTVVPVHVKVDTGMGRLGVFPEELPRFLEELAAMEGIRVEAIFSHLAAGETPSHPYTRKQLSLFIGALARIPGPAPRVHIANSGALLGSLEPRMAMVRPGIALYGASPGPDLPGAQALRPVMSFRSRILHLKKVPRGTSISYGMTHITEKEAWIATIPVGYADGYARGLSNRAEALVGGTRVPVVGTVCMNLTMLDVSRVPRAAVGDEVVLLGPQGPEKITAEELASHMGTISYEVLCAVGRANPRVYVDRPETKKATF